MIQDLQKYELFGKTLMQKMVLKTPFRFTFPVTDNACFIYLLGGDMQYQVDEELIDLPNRHSLFLNCINSGKQISNSSTGSNNELIIINFHPDTLEKIYLRELPSLLRSPKQIVSNRSIEHINNDFLIHKFIEGLLFYFNHPSLVNEDILILKLKEIVLLLSQTQNAGAIQFILSQLFSPTAYTFKQIIEAHLFSQISIEELARQQNLSLSSFKREFARLYEDTPANYIKTKRLEKAAELLVISNERITDIAFECGFNDLANFSKSFQDRYDITPSSYRLNGNAK
jgi:AraC-like DNA-binding protein